MPKTSNVNSQPKVTVANAAFIAVGAMAGNFAIRVYAAMASHLIVDLARVVFGGEPSEPMPPLAGKTGRRGEQARRIAKMRRAVQQSFGH